ncbi:hypothetical protein [Methylobacterium nigriterrae]|uniref:hypothetical protein n=1 Tax=Methylobacterium nigriterrae TaxID=3127512 RepID=UPI003013DD50
MRTITTKEDLVELLFEELDESEPRQDVDPNFLLRIGGLCLGLIFGGCAGVPPYLFDTLAIHYEDREATRCGTKLVTFARSLAAEECFDATRVWTITRLIERMLAALDSDDLCIHQEPSTGYRRVVSSGGFERRRSVKVRVRIGHAERM